MEPDEHGKNKLHLLAYTKEKQIMRLAFWVAAYILTMALASFGPEFLWNNSELLFIAGILLNLAVGIGMIMANIKHLDEMM